MIVFGRGGKKTVPSKMLAKILRGGGYFEVNLSVAGKRNGYCVHRLVASAFIPNIENKAQVNHINGIKTDNRLENLEWVTPSENTLHAINTGLLRVRLGEEKGGRAILKNKEVVEIKKMLQEGIMTQAKIGELFGVSRSTIGLIHNKNIWTHI